MTDTKMNISNIPAKILEKIGKNLHKQKNHPLCKNGF